MEILIFQANIELYEKPWSPVNAKVIGNGLGDKMLAYSTGMYCNTVIA